MNKNKKAYVSVHLDDDVPEHMAGIVRCESVISEDEDGNELKFHEELIDNSKFSSEDEFVEHIASMLGVSKDIVGIDV